MQIGIFILAIILMTVVCAWRAKRTTGIDAQDRTWNMIPAYKNSKEAAELLARVNARMIEFMRTLKSKYHIDEPDDEAASHSHTDWPNDIREKINHLLDNYNPDMFYENDPKYTTETSYTINKGAAMYICVRNKADPTKLVDENDLFFVMLHEASHIANYRGWGHGPDFWETFKFILHEAALAGVYTPVNYELHPMTYCGLYVAYNPYFDESLAELWV